MIYLNTSNNHLPFKAGFERVIRDPEIVKAIMKTFSCEEKFAFSKILGQLEEDVFKSSIKGDVKLTVAPFYNNKTVSAMATFEPPAGSNNLHRTSVNFLTTPEKALYYQMNPEKVDKSSRSIPTVDLFIDKIKTALGINT